MILLDTDHLSVLLDERDARQPLLWTRLDDADDQLAIPIVCVEEQLRGWLAKNHRAQDPQRQIVPYQRLAKAFTLLRDWPIIDWNKPAADQFSAVRHLRTRIGPQDLKIACIALANRAMLLSANLRDFEQVPSLRVESWLE